MITLTRGGTSPSASFELDPLARISEEAAVVVVAHDHTGRIAQTERRARHIVPNCGAGGYGGVATYPIATDYLYVCTEPHAIPDDRSGAVRRGRDVRQPAYRAVCSDPASSHPDGAEVSDIKAWTNVGRQLESDIEDQMDVAAEQVIERPANGQQWPEVVLVLGAQQPAPQAIGEESLQAVTARKQPTESTVRPVFVSEAADIDDKRASHKLARATSWTTVSERRNAEFSKLVRTI